MLNENNIWDQIYSNAHLTLKNKEDAEDLLSYPGYKNFVLVPEIVYEENGRTMSRPLNKEDAEKYNLKYSEHRIKRAAQLNMETKNEPLLLWLRHYLFEHTANTNLLSESCDDTYDTPEILILTNTWMFHGAEALFRDHVIDRIHNIIKEGFVAVIDNEDFCYIVPETIMRAETNTNIEDELKNFKNMLWFPENSTIHDGKFCYLYTMTDEEIKKYPFINDQGEAAFYRYVVEHFCGHNYDEIASCDCTKIDVAKNIQDYWFENEEKRAFDDYRSKYGREPYEGALNESRTQFAMFLAMSGPKAMEDLPNNAIRFSEDFITL